MQLYIIYTYIFVNMISIYYNIYSSERAKNTKTFQQ